MPARAAIKIAALRDLAAQQRFTPARAIARQVANIEHFVTQINPEHTYTQQEIVTRITGYRANIDEPDQVTGEELLENLSALCESLCDQAKLRQEHAPPGSLAIGQLAQRWSVSRKTIERWRRRGLIARRIRQVHDAAVQRTARGGGLVKLVFSPSIIAWFEEQHHKTLTKAASFARTSDQEAARIIDLAKHFKQAHGGSPSSIAHAIAHDVNRSPQAILQLINRHDEKQRNTSNTSEHQGVFRQRSPLSPRQRRFIERAAGFAVPIAQIARRVDRSPATVQRVLREKELDYLLRLPWPDPPPKEQLEPLRVEHILNRSAELVPLPHWPAGLPPVDPAGVSLAAKDIGPGNPQREQAAGTAMRVLIERARLQLTNLQRTSPKAPPIEAAHADLRRAALLQMALIRAELPLLVRTLEQTLGSSLVTAPAHLAHRAIQIGLRATAAGVLRYEPWRGGRPAAPVSLALTRTLAKAGRTSPYPSGPAADAQQVRELASVHIAPVQLSREIVFAGRLWPSEHLLRHITALEEKQRVILYRRFGLAGELPCTLDQLASEGVKPQTVAAALRRARAGV